MENATNNSNNKNGIKRKIPMELIQKENYRQVCFTKRRKGLFKKAKELSVLCGVNVKILAFSPAGNPYFYASPGSSSSTLDQLFPSSRQTAGDTSEHPNSVADLARQASELRAQLDASKRKNQSLKALLKATKESMSSTNLANADLAQLMKLKRNLEQNIKVVSLSQVNGSSNMLVHAVPEMSVGTGTIPDMGVGTGTVTSHPASYLGND